MGVAQETVGPFDLPQLHQAADVGGTDGDTADLYLGDDVTAKAQLSAFLHQQLRGALVLVAEVVVVTRHQVDGVVAIYQNLGDEIGPGGGPHLVVKRDHDDIPDAVEAAYQVRPVLGRIDEGAGNAGEDLLRHPVEGEHRRGDTPGGGFLRRAPQQGGVAQVDSVKEAQGNDSFFHGYYAPKKFLMDVSVPRWARERHRKSPFLP